MCLRLEKGKKKKAPSTTQINIEEKKRRGNLLQLPCGRPRQRGGTKVHIGPAPNNSLINLEGSGEERRNVLWRKGVMLISLRSHLEEKRGGKTSA